MQMKRFYYLYMKARDEAKEAILKEADIDEQEYNTFEQELADEVRHIKAMRELHPQISEEFLQLTRYLYDHTPDQQKGIPRPSAVQPLHGDIIPLPAVGVIPKPEMTLWQAIEQRRSLREYDDTPLTQAELSFLLWSTQWAKDFRSNEKMEVTFRNVPSAGARHPFETYLLINRVEGIKPGIYYYHPLKHGLVLYKEGEAVTEEVTRMCFGQQMVTHSAVTFIWTCIPYRTAWRYTQRGYRYLFVDAGHVGQNLHLASEAIGGGACMIGAFLDEGMNDILALDGKDAFVIYMAAMGKRKET